MSDPVLVAGGGPAGLLLAAELALAGVPTVVLEGAAGPPDNSCGMVLHARSVAALRHRGIADRFVGPDTPVWPRTHFGLLWLDVSDLRGTDDEYLVPQWRTVRLLTERAAELGAEVRYAHRVTGVEQDPSGVTVTVRTPAGERTLRGAYLVGCDGPDSSVARLAGFEYDLLAPAHYGAMADVSVPDTDREHFRAGSFPAGQFGVLPVNPADPREVRLMTVEFRREPPPPDEPVTVDELRASIERVTGTAPPIGEPRWLARFGGPSRLAREYRRGRILLAGDAAHSYPPSSGNGLNTALHDAFNLGWKLAGTVHGWAPAGLLDSYQEERHPVGRRACVRALAQIPLQYPADQAGPLREVFAELLTISEVNRFLVQLVTNVRYPLAGPDHPLLGDVLPDGVASLTTGRGLVLLLGGPDTTGPAGLAAWSDRVDVVTAGPVAGIDAETLLIRPDGHVAFAGRPGYDGDALRLALKTWFG